MGSWRAWVEICAGRQNTASRRINHGPEGEIPVCRAGFWRTVLAAVGACENCAGCRQAPLRLLLCGAVGGVLGETLDESLEAARAGLGCARLLEQLDDHALGGRRGALKGRGGRGAELQGAT